MSRRLTFEITPDTAGKTIRSFLREELVKLKIPARRVRFEVFGQAKDITAFAGYPVDQPPYYRRRYQPLSYRCESGNL